MSEERLITEDWLRASGFRWHELERQGAKHWVLWLGDICCSGGFGSFEDLGVEVAMHTIGPDGTLEDWFCWLRGDYSHRYSRFIHVRHLKTCEELIALIEGVTGQKWNTENNLYGSMRTPEQAARLRKADEEFKKRADVKFLRDNWHASEKDGDRGRPLIEHVQGAIDGGKAK